jgi:presenilin-like A22 family membrane protease
MKHPPNVFMLLISIFLAAQIIGLFVVNSYVDIQASNNASIENGEPTTVYQPAPYGLEPPSLSGGESLIYIFGSILFGTLLLFVIIKFRKAGLWRFWFFAAIVMTVSISFAAFLPAEIRYDTFSLFAIAAVSILIAYFKIYRPSILAHNIGELFIYGGLAAIFVRIMNIWTAALLLILISVYDFIAVFMSKHMIALAKFQTSNQLFAGVMVPKQLSAKSAVSGMSVATPDFVENESKKNYSDSGAYAVVGGGDIGFPLLFAAVSLFSFGFLKTLIIPIFATIALVVLLTIGKRGKFYPAMPFITIGCFVGYGIALLLP